MLDKPTPRALDIDRFRAEQGLSINELTDALDISRATYYSWIEQPQKMQGPMRVLMRLCRKHKVKVKDA